jgi:hypothetical protein
MAQSCSIHGCLISLYIYGLGLHFSYTQLPFGIKTSGILNSSLRLLVVMVPPLCSGCGGALAALKSLSLRSRWAEYEGERWGWTSDQLAYWTLCVDCHRNVWPLDRRYNNAASRPFTYPATGPRDGLCLTVPPPEYLRRILVKAAPSAALAAGSGLPSSSSSSSSSSSFAGPSGSSVVLFLQTCLPSGVPWLPFGGALLFAN